MHDAPNLQCAPAGHQGLLRPMVWIQNQMAMIYFIHEDVQSAKADRGPGSAQLQCRSPYMAVGSLVHGLAPPGSGLCLSAPPLAPA